MKRNLSNYSMRFLINLDQKARPRHSEKENSRSILLIKLTTTTKKKLAKTPNQNIGDIPNINTAKLNPSMYKNSE